MGIYEWVITITPKKSQGWTPAKIPLGPALEPLGQALEPIEVKSGRTALRESLAQEICQNGRCSRLEVYFWLTMYGCFQKYGKTTQIINFNRVFHYKPCILGFFPLFLETSVSWLTGIFPNFIPDMILRVIKEIKWLVMCFFSFSTWTFQRVPNGS